MLCDNKILQILILKLLMLQNIIHTVCGKVTHCEKCTVVVSDLHGHFILTAQVF